jgi:hypothetical protein
MHMQRRSQPSPQLRRTRSIGPKGQRPSAAKTEHGGVQIATKGAAPTITLTGQTHGSCYTALTGHPPHASKTACSVCFSLCDHEAGGLWSFSAHLQFGDSGGMRLLCLIYRLFHWLERGGGGRGVADEERSEMNDVLLERTWLQNADAFAQPTRLSDS